MKNFKIIALIGALSLFCVNFFAQDNLSENSNSTRIIQEEKSQALPDEATLPIGAATSQTRAVSQGAPARKISTVWIFFRMIFVLIVIIVCIYFVMNFMKKKMAGTIADDDTFLRKVAQVTVAPGKTVQIVTLLEHAYLIGVTDNSIDLLGEITDKELVDAMNLNADRNEHTERARNFGDILSLFISPKNSGSVGGEKKVSSSIADFFKSQKDKINGKNNGGQ